jgi:UDP-N-acetylglucosamine--N-acetylmuramyl-(pentapeptide) pyrophosphoryl-undecaprenol N-acetylglucosamine transferase
MKLLIVAGGGGHFVAALAVIQELPKDWQIVVVGRKYALEGDTALALEYQTCQKLGIPFETLTTGRLQRKISKQTFSSLLKIPSGVNEARKLIAEHRPDIVVSFGGYVSVPVVMAAAFARLPIVVHEQTHHAGLANKLASKFAAKICVSWNDSEKFFPREKTILTGNPLRKEFLAAQSLKPAHPAHAMIKKVLQNLPKGTLAISNRKTPTIYITGGSAGAHGVNILIEGCIKRLLPRYRVIHQTGDAQEFGDYDRLEALRQTLPEELQKRYELHKFIEPNSVADILSQADLVVSRSGINTVTELMYLGKPTLFIPLPYGQRNEQQTNAEYVKQIGMAEIVNQNTINSLFLQTRIETMMQNIAQYKKNGDTAKELIKVDASQHIVDVIKDVYAQKDNQK